MNKEINEVFSNVLSFSSLESKRISDVFEEFNKRISSNLNSDIIDDNYLYSKKNLVHLMEQLNSLSKDYIFKKRILEAKEKNLKNIISNVGKVLKKIVAFNNYESETKDIIEELNEKKQKLLGQGGDLNHDDKESLRQLSDLFQ